MARVSNFSYDGEEMNAEAHPHPGPWIPMSSSRVERARYDSGLEQIQLVFRDGTPWVYDSVPANIWRNFRRSTSPGKYINRVLNSYAYWHGAFDTSDLVGGDADSV